MKPEKYIGMDVHQSTISVAVMDSSGTVKVYWHGCSPGNDLGCRHGQLIHVLAVVCAPIQSEVLHSQEAEAQHLLSIETLRVRKKVDDPAALTRAKLVLARTRMWLAQRDVYELRFGKQLADLTGLPEQQIKVVADSIPSFPNVFGDDIEMQAAMGEVTAARDVAQLEHILARDRRMRTRVKSLLLPVPTWAS